VIVLSLKWSAAVAFWECFEDFGRNELGAEERAVGGHVGVWRMPGFAVEVYKRVWEVC
jgi:hypothetical protein